MVPLLIADAALAGPLLFVSLPCLCDPSFFGVPPPWERCPDLGPLADYNRPAIFRTILSTSYMSHSHLLAYSNEKPGVPTETPGCKTNPLTFEVIKGVVSGRPLRPIVSLLIFVCESYFRIHDRLHLAPISTIKMTSIGCKASFQGGTDTEKRAPGSIFFFHQVWTD